MNADEQQCAICGIGSTDVSYVRKWLNYNLELREVPDLGDVLCTDCIARLKDLLFTQVYGGLTTNKNTTIADLRQKCIAVAKLNSASKARLANVVACLCTKISSTTFTNENDDDDVNGWYDEVSRLVSSVANVYGFEVIVDFQEVDDSQRVITISIHDPYDDVWHRMPIPISRIIKDTDDPNDVLPGIPPNINIPE